MTLQKKNNQSTSMQYAKTSSTEKNIKVAVRINKSLNDVNNTFVELGINSPIDNHPIKIKSDLKNIQTAFIREIYNNFKPNLNIALGLNYKLKNQIFLNGNINFIINKNNYKQLYYSIGFNQKF